MKCELCGKDMRWWQGRDETWKSSLIGHKKCVKVDDELYFTDREKWNRQNSYPINS